MKPLKSISRSNLSSSFSSSVFDLKSSKFTLTLKSSSSESSSVISNSAAYGSSSSSSYSSSSSSSSSSKSNPRLFFTAFISLITKYSAANMTRIRTTPKVAFFIIVILVFSGVFCEFQIFCFPDSTV